MKIYVTGLGVVSGIGLGVAENIASLRKHQHGMKEDYGKSSLMTAVQVLK